jgi:pyruvate/2-oxoglutarate dehydrogenase complex dihydrolipoamide acyltransferase (E2) component
VLKPPSYQLQPWPKLRDALVTFLEAHRPHTYYGFTEADVTEALQAIERLRRESRAAVSFHAYVLHCLAQASLAHPAVLSYRRGRRILTFEDVDIGTTIERRLPDGSRIPVAYILRAAEGKSLARINWELREAARRDPAEDETIRLRRRILGLPGFVRRLVRRRMSRDPLLLRRFFGTIGCTNLQIVGSERAGFALPPNVHTATVAVGWITDRLVPGADGTPQKRRMLCLACGIDHAVADGIPISRWAQSFHERLESAAGLDDSFVAETRALRGRTAQ